MILEKRLMNIDFRKKLTSEHKSGRFPNIISFVTMLLEKTKVIRSVDLSRGLYNSVNVLYNAKKNTLAIFFLLQTH